MSVSGDEAPIVKPGANRQPSIMDDNEATAEDPIPPQPDSPEVKYTEPDKTIDDINNNGNDGQGADKNSNVDKPQLATQVPSVTATTTATLTTGVAPGGIKTDMAEAAKYDFDQMEAESKNDGGIEMQEYSNGNLISPSGTLVMSQFQLAVQSQDLNDHQLIARFAITLTYLLFRFVFFLLFFFSFYFLFDTFSKHKHKQTMKFTQSSRFSIMAKSY